MVAVQFSADSTLNAAQFATKSLASLRCRFIRLLCYLDDILVLSSSPQQAVVHVRLTLETQASHSFSVNLEKSHLVPTTRLQHLGTLINSVQGRVYLSQDRQDSLRALVSPIEGCHTAFPFVLS